jgi:hypothetical protein
VTSVPQRPLQVIAPIGIGRALRVSFAACHSVGIDAKVRDVWDLHKPEGAHAAFIEPFVTTEYASVNVFHINGDEVETTLERIGPLPPGHSIIVLFWELPWYPAGWAGQLERFDEVWAASDFIRESVRAAVDCPVIHMPLATRLRSTRVAAGQAEPGEISLADAAPGHGDHSRSWPLRSPTR